MELPKIDFRFTRSGIIVVAILLVVGYLLQAMQFDFFALFTKPEDFLFFPIASLLVAVGIIVLWFIIGARYGPTMGNLLVENRVIALLFVRGDKYYFEKVSEEEHVVTGPFVLSRFITFFISWLSISSSLVSLFGNILGGLFFPGPTIDPVINLLGNNGLEGIAWKFLLIMVIAPLILTLIIPITWLLLDVRLKALHSGSMTNWFVGTKVQSRLNGFISIGALIALGGSFGLDQLVDKLTTIISLVFYCIFYISFPMILIITLYSLLFHTTFYEKFLDAIPVPYGETNVEFFVKERKYEGMKVKIKKEEEIRPGLEIEEGPEEEIEEGPEEEIEEGIGEEIEEGPEEDF
ncbi:MAG: hypothetical protein ACXAEU_14800 [Candidatus Hodarchaeales archaeon]